jgi:uncharacterized protein
MRVLVAGSGGMSGMLAVLLRLVVGEMADALLLASRRIEPRRLLQSGYEFRYPGLEAAIRHQLRVTT